MKIVLRLASIDIETIAMITKQRNRHSSASMVRKIQEFDRILTEGDGVAAALRQHNFTEAA